MQNTSSTTLLHALSRSLLLISTIMLVLTGAALGLFAQRNIGKESTLVPNVAALLELLEAPSAPTRQELLSSLQTIARNPDTDKLRLQLSTARGEAVFDSGSSIEDDKGTDLSAWLLLLARPEKRPTWQRDIAVRDSTEPLRLTVSANPHSEAQEAADNLLVALGALLTLTATLHAAIRWRLRKAFQPLQSITRHLQLLENNMDSAPPLTDAGTRELSIITRSINHLQQELAHQHQQQQELMNRLQDLQESERRQIADELHDELGQHLTALQVDAATLIKRLMQEVQTPSQNPTQTQEPTLALAHSLLENSQTLLRQLRNLLQQLRPAGLEGDHDQTRALQRAIESLADQWRQRLAGQTDIVVNLQLPAANLPSRLSLACYRIVQEALTNAARHAQASRIDLTIRHELGDAGLFVEIRDNGIGRIDQTETPHAGPRSLQERAHGQAGRLTLLQNQPSGWIVQLTLPMYE